MSKRYYIFSILIAVSLILAACGGSTQAPEQCADNPDETVCAVIEPGKTVKLGYGGPMTGDPAAFGIDISNGGLLAVEDANEAGGVEGFDFELLIGDTQGTGEGGASVANLFVSDPDVVAIPGHTFTDSTAAAIPIYNEARLPMMCPSATNAKLVLGDQDVFNRIPFTDDAQGQFAAEYLYNVLGITKLAAMHDGTAYGKGVAERVQEVFTSLGGEVVAFAAITSGETDYSAVLTDIGASEPEAIYFGGYYPEAAVLAQGMPVAGLEGVILFSDDGVFGSTFLELAGEYAEGVYAVSGAPASSPKVEEFNAYFTSVYGNAPGSLSTFTWHGYDVVDVLIHAIKSTAILGDDGNLYIPREALVTAVKTTTGFEALTGTLTCNGGECNASGPSFMVVKDGEWVFP